MAQPSLEHLLQLAEELSPAERTALVERLQVTSHDPAAEVDAEWGDMIEQMAGSSDDDPM